MQRTVLPAVPPTIAIGDLHGNLEDARGTFMLGGLIDEDDRWVGNPVPGIGAPGRRLSTYNRM